MTRPNNAFGGLTLTPWGERERTQREIQQQFQAEAQKISGLEVFSFAEPGLPGADAGLPINFVVASTANYLEVDRVSEELLREARESDLFEFVTKTLQLEDINRAFELMHEGEVIRTVIQY